LANNGGSKYLRKITISKSPNIKKSKINIKKKCSKRPINLKNISEQNQHQEEMF
jgi:hypothetical protein